MVAEDGRLWVATRNGAAILKSWDGKRATFDVLQQRFSLPPWPIESLIQEKDGHVWLGAHIRLNPSNWAWQEFGSVDGISFRNFFIASRNLTQQGQLLFGSPQGLLIVEPQKIQQWNYTPQAMASRLTVNGKERPVATTMPALKIPSDQNSLQVEFTSLAFSAPEKLQYRYRLSPYDTDWISADATHRLASYQHIPPGNYQLYIQGTNRVGQWSPKQWQLTISVMPAFYQTWYFQH